MRTPGRCSSFLVLLLSILLLITHVQARETKTIFGTDGAGITRELAVDRTPALYTGDFGDCLGGQSLFNITKFDAAYYADNLTIIFHLDGTTNIKNENLMMHISVDAYGKSRYAQIFDPCMINVYSLCPLKADQPVEAWAIIPVGPQQIGGIPSIAFDIPDFEGSAKIQIFANSSKTEIGCFQAVMRNGNSFSHPEAISPILGIFTIIAILASFFTAAYGVSISHMRSHYAHSLSVMVVFETFQAIFFSGALSVNWPSVLVAWWSNFAWSAGLIYDRRIVHSVDSFAGVSGNASQVGGAGSTVINNGGGLAGQIYGRLVGASAQLMKRAPYNESDPYDYTWAGDPVTPGMPLPGSWVGFPGTLSGIDVPAPDAFFVGLIWLFIAILLVAGCVAALKLCLEGLRKVRWIKEDRLAYFRSHWTKYLDLALLRTLHIAFFAIITLAIYEFNVKAPAGATAVAAIAFSLVLLGVGASVAYGLHRRLRHGRFVKARKLDAEKKEQPPSLLGYAHVNDDPSRATVHEDLVYIKKYGWLSARYRRTRWWFFASYFGYQFVRACFIGGGVRSPLAQICGLLIVDVIAFGVLVRLRPFEGRRNTALAAWMLSISKIVTTGASITFLPSLRVDRIIATAVGIIIIVVQGFMVIALMILVILGAISSYMSLTRNREEFKPEALEGLRFRYFEHILARAPDVPLPPKEKQKDKGKEPEPAPAPAVPQEPSFAVTSVRRAPKIEDEDGDVLPDLGVHTNNSGFFDPDKPRTRVSRASSLGSRQSMSNLPRGARLHRASWSSRDFAQWEAQMERPESSRSHHRLSASSLTMLENNAEVAASSPIVTSPVQTQTSRNSLRMASPIQTQASRNSLRMASPIQTQASKNSLRIASPAPTAVKTQASRQSLQEDTSPGSRPMSPLSPNRPNTPGLETLLKHADERKFSNPRPATDPQPDPQP